MTAAFAADGLAGDGPVDDARRYRLAELADFLRGLSAAEFSEATREAPNAPLDADTLNHLAGAIELAASRRDLAPPKWTRGVPPGTVPRFGSSLASVRLYLLPHAPVALRRRHLFFDSSLDARG